MKFMLVIASLIAVAVAGPTRGLVSPGMPGPTPVETPISVGPAIIDGFNPVDIIPVNPVVVPSPVIEVPSADGSVLVQIILNVNGASAEVVPSPVEVPVVPEVIIPGPVNIVDGPETVLPEPVVIGPPALPEVVVPEPVVIGPPALPEIVVPEPVVIGTPSLPEVISPVVVGTPIVPAPVVVLPETLN